MAEAQPAPKDAVAASAGPAPPPERNWLRRHAALVIAVVLVVALAVGVQWVTGAHTLWALLLSPLLFFRTVIWKIGVNRILMILAFALVPVVLRRRVRAYLSQQVRRLRDWVGRVYAALADAASHLPVWVRTALGLLILVAVMAVAILSGTFLWLIAFLPFVAKTTVGIATIRYLAHKAAATGLAQAAPTAWRIVPRPIREWLGRRYRHLWWWTMRRIVKNRRRVERRVRRQFAGSAAPTTAQLALGDGEADEGNRGV